MSVQEQQGTTTPRDRKVDRKSLWLAIAGGLGIIIGVVALIIAISAKNASENDAQVTARVNRDAQLAVAGIHNQLQQDIASATTVLRQLQVSSTAASQARSALQNGINQTKSGIASNRTSITSMQAQINTVTAEVHRLSTTVSKLSTNLTALTKRVDALEKSSP
jgi:chromosome segregation ATPase